MSGFPVSSTACLAAALGALLAASSALAEEKPRSFVQNATGACQSALPVYDGQIRKRPLALQNEGTASAYVSCSFMSTVDGIGGSRSIGGVFLYADNNTGSDVDMTCTLVDGISGSAPIYIPKTITMSANSRGNTFYWLVNDNGGERFYVTVNASCNLPVGVGLTSSFIFFLEEVGA